jgi:hypothetical protein
VGALRKIPFDRNTNDFHFDTEIIIQLVIAGMRVREVSIPTYYGDEICYVNGIRYAWNHHNDGEVAHSGMEHLV